LKYLIISDIHSNLEAFEAVLNDAASHRCDKVVCLGDFVGYGANPNECVHKFLELPDAVAVLGNHDAAVLNPAEREMFNPVAKAGVAYSEEQIDDESRKFLRSLPFTRNPGDGFMVAHASPSRPESWIYVIEPLEAADAFHAMEEPLGFIGHTHFPAVYTATGIVRPFAVGETVRLDAASQWLINVGSVGQPRDGDPRTAYVVYDASQGTVNIHRVEYDIDTTAAKIQNAGLPPMLGDRLRRGY